ncbi:MAG: TonB-dependent receptor [Gemmatimonadota bacterium]|nr:TonB-dependent receptor [Gemmatimonadota bacterium]
MRGEPGIDPRIPGTERALALVLAVLGIAAFPPGASGQQASVTGRVLSVDAGEPIPEVTVAIAGTGVVTLTDADGRFTLSAAAGQVTVVARRIGYVAQSRELELTAGAAVEIEFRLAISVLGLEDVVVTVAGERQRRALGHNIATIPADSIVDGQTVPDLIELLTGRVPGLLVQASGGTTGTGASIRVRGASSVSLSNEPLVYLDGVRVNADPASMSNYVGGETPSRLNDLNPEEIASIDVVTGPSAAAMYGTDAANGVIVIRTLSGTADGPARVRSWAEGGTISDRTDYPANFEAVDDAGVACPLVAASAGDCAQAELRSFNPLEDPSTNPFLVGNRFQVGANVAAGGAGSRYFLSGEWERERGLYENNGFERVSVRANVGFDVTERVDIQMNAGYASSDLELPQNGQGSYGVIAEGLFGTAEPDGWRSDPDYFDAIRTEQGIERFTGSLALGWSPKPWLDVRATAGLDATHRTDDQFVPRGEVDDPQLELGFRDADRHERHVYTVDGLAQAWWDLRPDLAARTSLGVQYFRDHGSSVHAEGVELSPGSISVDASAETLAFDSYDESRTLGTFVEQQLAWRERLYLTVGLRADDNSAFGESFDFVVYPKAGVSWVASDEPWFSARGPLNSLRLRAAWGVAGTQPNGSEALTLLFPLPVTDLDGENESGIYFGRVGNPDVKPERTTEIEGGADAELFGGRLALSLTLFHQRTTDALVSVPIAPSLGIGFNRWENIGETVTRGLEGVVNARVAEWGSTRFDLMLSGALLDGELVTLGKDIAPFVNDAQRHVPGYPLGAYWELPIESFGDANGDGIISPEEVAVGDTAVFIDEALPPVQGVARPVLSFGDRVYVRASFEARAGHSLWNGTEWLRCRGGRSRRVHDRAAPLEDQAACVAAIHGGTAAGFIETASFVRWRELAVTLEAPPSWLRALGFERAALTLSGRNLGLWTSYPGLDPEVSLVTGDELFTVDFSTQPPVRYWAARLSLTF